MAAQVYQQVAHSSPDDCKPDAVYDGIPGKAGLTRGIGAGGLCPLLSDNLKEKLLSKAA